MENTRTIHIHTRIYAHSLTTHNFGPKRFSPSFIPHIIVFVSRIPLLLIHYHSFVYIYILVLVISLRFFTRTHNTNPPCLLGVFQESVYFRFQTPMLLTTETSWRQHNRPATKPMTCMLEYCHNETKPLSSVFLGVRSL